MTGNLNWYDLYRPVYPSTLSAAQAGERKYGEVEIGGEIKKYRLGYTMDEYTPWMKRLTQGKNTITFGDYVTEYINRKDVRAAMNIPDSIQAWEQCAYNLDYRSQPEGSLWIYFLLQNKVRMLFYSGDTDGAVPTWGTRQWIETLGWKTTEEYRSWQISDQVSGYVQSYDGLDFVTIHGVGHMAPQWKRPDVTTMITNWIHQRPF